jgi:uncharacterized membrane protein required for colicin V production
MTEFDLMAVALVLVFAYSGYRRGLIAFALQLAGGVLAFALAAALAPYLAPRLATLTDLPGALFRPALVVALTGLLRFVFGFALREVGYTLRTLLRLVPPLALLDRVLGIVPGTALGVVVVLALTLAALTLPVHPGLRDAAAASWLARHVIARPEQTLRALRQLWEGWVVTPPRISLLPLAAGTGGLWLGAIAGYRLRRSLGVAAVRAAPTVRVPRIAPGEAEAAGELALARLVLGVLTAGALIAALLAYGLLRAG